MYAIVRVRSEIHTEVVNAIQEVGPPSPSGNIGCGKASSWEAIGRSARDPLVDMIVVDITMDMGTTETKVAEDRRSALLALMGAARQEEKIVVVITPGTARAMSEVSNVARLLEDHSLLQAAGTFTVVIHPHENMGRRIAVDLRRAMTQSTSGRLAERFLAEHLGAELQRLDRVNPKLRSGLETTYAIPGLVREIDDLATVSRISRSTVIRCVPAAGFRSPYVVILGGQLIHAFTLLPHVPLEAVAGRTGFVSANALSYHCHAALGQKPAWVRENLAETEFLLAIRQFVT